MSRVFVDTNVFAYQFDEAAPEKQTRARARLRQEHDFVLSTQVLLELYVVLTRRFDPALDESAALQVVDTLSGLQVVAADAQLVRRAIATSRAHRISVWDAMIVEAAVESGCTELWTEDLTTGATLRGVHVVDPLLV